MMAGTVYATVRLTGLLAVHPLWRACFPRGVGLVVASAFAAALVGSVSPLDALEPAALSEAGAWWRGGLSSWEDVVVTLIMELVIGVVLGVLVALPFLGIAGGAGLVGTLLGCSGPSRATWVRLHLLLTGWLFFAAAPYVPGLTGLLTLSGAHAADGLGARELLATLAAPQEALAVVAELAEWSLVVSVAVCAPAVVAGGVIYGIAEFGTADQPRIRREIQPVARTVAMVAVVVAWTASWGLASVERAMTLSLGL